MEICFIHNRNSKYRLNPRIRFQSVSPSSHCGLVTDSWAAFPAQASASLYVLLFLCVLMLVDDLHATSLPEEALATALFLFFPWPTFGLCQIPLSSASCRHRSPFLSGALPPFFLLPVLPWFSTIFGHLWGCVCDEHEWCWVECESDSLWFVAMCACIPVRRWASFCSALRVCVCVCVCVVERWGTEEVGIWLEQLSLGEYRETFIRHDIRGSELLHLERRDLKVHTCLLAHVSPTVNLCELFLFVSCISDAL